MSVPRRRTEPESLKAEKYQRRYGEIIDAAAAVFAEKGYHGSSTKDIADRLGIRQGSLYYYFESKEAALEEVCKIGVEGFVQQLEAILASDLQPAEMLRAAVHNHLDPLEDRPNYVRVFQRQRHELPPARRRTISAVARHYEKLLQTMFERGVAAGAFRADLDCRLATLGLLGMCNAVGDWHDGEPGTTICEIAENFAAILTIGVKKTKG
jgi:TetR/AcrR family transcriptional regulator, cholesterol catabolism regulator